MLGGLDNRSDPVLHPPRQNWYEAAVTAVTAVTAVMVVTAVTAPAYPAASR